MKSLPSSFYFHPVALLAFFSCGQPATDEAQNAETVQDNVQTKVVNVKAETLAPQDFSATYEVIGHVEAKDDVILSSEASGRIVRYWVEEGDRVNAEQPLAKIDDALLRAERDRLAASVNQSKENYERIGRLWNEDGIGSEMDFINAKYTFQQAEAALKNVVTQIEKTTLQAPFAGVVDRKLTNVGETVAPGTQMLRLIDDRTIVVAGGVPSRYAGVVKKGSPVKISLDSYPDTTFVGYIRFVAPSIDPSSRTFRLEVELKNPDSQIKIDAQARIEIETARHSEVIVVHNEYVTRNENGYQVFLVQRDEEGNFIAQIRKVSLGARSNNRVVITEGLEPGDQLITVGFSLVENKSKINVVESTTTVASTH